MAYVCVSMDYRIFNKRLEYHLMDMTIVRHVRN